jgi:hypothetical protein
LHLRQEDENLRGREVRPERSERTLRQQRPAGRATQWRVILYHRPNSKSLLNEQAFLHLGFCSPGKQSAAGGKMRLWWSFRSPDVLCFSIATEPVNVPGWLTATPWRPGLPAKKIAAGAPLFAPSLGITPTGLAQALFKIAPGNFVVLCRLTFGSGTSLRPCRLSPPPASLRAAPVSRQRLIDFQPDPVIAVTVWFSLRGVIAVKRNITGDPSPSRERGKLVFAWCFVWRQIPAILCWRPPNPSPHSWEKVRENHPLLLPFHNLISPCRVTVL